jgi:hypothetical protein
MKLPGKKGGAVEVIRSVIDKLIKETTIQVAQRVKRVFTLNESLAPEGMAVSL